MGAADGELPPHPRGFVVASGRAPMDYEAVSRWVEHQASVSSVLPLMQSVAPHPPSQRRRRKKKKRSASAAGRGEGPKLDWDARHPVLFSSSNPNAVPVSSSSSSAAVSHWFAQQLMREEQKWEQRQEELCARIARGVIGHHGQDEGRYGVKSPNVARTHVQHRAATAIDHELAHDHSEDVVADAEVAGIMGVAPTSCEHCLPGEASEHERVGADMKNGGYVSHRSFGGKSSIGGFHGASDTY
eukprot:jgi/Chlat1/8580/Chrsp82S07967